jgi:hypothetical protein
VEVQGRDWPAAIRKGVVAKNNGRCLFAPAASSIISEFLSPFIYLSLCLFSFLLNRLTFLFQMALVAAGADPNRLEADLREMHKYCPQQMVYKLKF